MNKLHNDEQAPYALQLRLLLILCAIVLYFNTYNLISDSRYSGLILYFIHYTLYYA